MHWFVIALSIVVSACAPGISTKRIDMPAGQSGQLDLVVRSEGAIPAEELQKAKVRLKRSFREAGYDPVVLADTGQGRPLAIEIALSSYAQSNPANNTTVAVGVGSAYLCPLVAPCLLFRIYYEPQFEISADVAVYRNGQRTFGRTVTERSAASASLIDTGDDRFRSELEDLAVHNFTSRVVGSLRESARDR